MLALAALLSLSACSSMAPDYERPAMPVQQSVGSVTSEAQDFTPMPWQQVFVDSRLQQVIEQAISNNRDLRVSLLNVEKAQAQYRIQSASLLPTVAATASQSNARSAVASSTSVQGQTSHAGGLSVGFTSWELDLFGRVRSLKN